MKHNKVAANDFPVMITSVHESLSSLGPAAKPLTPAVPVRQSVRPDHLFVLSADFAARRSAGI